MVVFVKSSAPKFWPASSSRRFTLLAGFAVVALLFTMAMLPSVHATASPGPDATPQQYRSKDSTPAGFGPAMPYGYTSIVGNGGLLVPGTCTAGACGKANTMQDDEFSTSCLPLGFASFKFYGTSYNCMWVHSDGFMVPDNTATATMPGTTNPYQPLPIPNGLTPNNMIAAFWVDTYGSFCPKSTDGGIYYKATATAFYVEFKNVLLQDDSTFGGGSCLNNVPNNPSPVYLTFQAVFYPDSLTTVRQDAVEVFLASAAGPSTSGCQGFIYCEATIGVENAAGDQGLQYAYGTGTFANRAIRFFPNHGPAAQPVSATATSGGPSVTMALSAIDPDLDSDAADTFAVSTAVPAGQGSVSITGSTATYTPDATYCAAPVTFQYTASNQLGGFTFTGGPATGTITVTCGGGGPGNIAPTAACSISPAAPYTPNQVVTFSSTGSTDPDGTIAEYGWTFPGGASPASSTTDSQAVSWPAAGTYAVTLRVKDNSGTWSVLKNCPITIGPGGPPPACPLAVSFTVNGGTDLEAGTPVSFSDTSTDGPGKTKTDYAWDLGDGYISQQSAVSHAYQSAGTYLVRLTVKDNANCVASAEATLQIHDPGAQQPASTPEGGPSTGQAPPVVDAGEDQGTREGDRVVLSATAMSASSSLSFSWRQVDGPSVRLRNASSASPDFVAPSLTSSGASLVLHFAVHASDGVSDSDEDTVAVTVVARNQHAPVARAGNDLNIAKGTSVLLDGSASTDADGDSLTYSWVAFGGIAVQGLPGEGRNLTITVPAGTPGSFIDVQLTVSDGALIGADTVRIWLMSAPLPPAGFQATAQSDGSVFFAANSPASEYVWDFGDNATLTTQQATASHKYAEAGTYTVSLRLGAGADAVSQPVTSTAAATQHYGARTSSGQPGWMLGALIGGAIATLLVAAMLVVAFRHRNGK